MKSCKDCEYYHTETMRGPCKDCDDHKEWVSAKGSVSSIEEIPNYELPD